MNAVIELDTPDSELLLKSLYPELKNGKRSNTSADFTKKGIKISIETSDIIALRATFNSITKLLLIHERLK